MADLWGTRQPSQIDILRGAYPALDTRIRESGGGGGGGGGGGWGDSSPITGIQQAANKSYNDQSKIIEANRNAGLLSFEEAANELAMLRSNIKNQMANIQRSYGKAVKGLGQQRDQTIEGQRGYFSAISPEAYQSQQGVYENKAQNVYKEGLADLAYTKKQNERALAQASLRAAQQQKSLEAQQALFNAEGGEQGRANINFGSMPSLKNYDTTSYINALTQMTLNNLLTGQGGSGLGYQQVRFDQEGNPIEDEDYLNQFMNSAPQQQLY